MNFDPKNVDKDLDKRMEDAGMIPLSSMLENIPLGAFLANAGVKDLTTFEEWLNMRYKEMLRMKINMELGKYQDDELYEWVISHTAVLGEVLANYRQAKK